MSVKEVIVVNKGTRTFKDSFHGIEYVMEPGVKCPMPVAAAVHIFGFNQADKSARNKRSGFTDASKAEVFFSAFSLSIAEYVRKDEADEAEALREELAKKDALIEELMDANTVLKTENEQLKAKTE